ncbi:MAG: hypothetical protein H6916_12910 [Novosphingobium sp.]|uniref:hypothetical protein n=1 Tax=Novosphingobium sp. TaxID=1874826 RepID=UPI00262C2A69|nr:hypothetical protein [Novosphingobium sp.]MCP5387696.1 hypothetical protein [Novosphingobium sp.]
MSTTTQSILCGSCKSPAKTVPNPKPHDQVKCPRCGKSDRFDQVMKSVQAHVAHLTQQHLSESLAKAARGNSFIKFEIKKPAHRSFRWIIEKGL